MRFKVPQFIDIEDKIFGPFTFKQFMYLAGGAGLAYISYKFLPIYAALPLVLIFGGMAVSLAFVQINKKPFIFIMEAYIRYMINSKMFIWNKRNKVNEPTAVAKKADEIEVPRKKLTESKLRELSLGLNIIED